MLSWMTHLALMMLWVFEKIKNDVNALLIITQDAIKRAELVNPKLNAIAVADFDGAIARVENPIEGNFSGVPTFITLMR